MTPELSKSQQELIAKLGHPLVTEQGALTPYHLRKYWRNFSQLDPLYQGLYRLGRSAIDITYDFKPEAAAAIHSKRFTTLHVVMATDGNSPQEIPLFKRPFMNLKRVFHPELWDLLKEMGMTTVEKQNRAGFEIPLVRPKPEGLSGQFLPEDYFPTANEILTRPFPFLHPKQRGKILGKDPFRFEMIISGVSDELHYYCRSLASFIGLNQEEAFSGNKTLTYDGLNWRLRESDPQDQEWYTPIADAMVATGKFVSLSLDHRTFPLPKKS